MRRAEEETAANVSCAVQNGKECWQLSFCEYAKSILKKSLLLWYRSRLFCGSGIARFYHMRRSLTATLSRFDVEIHLAPLEIRPVLHM